MISFVLGNGVSRLDFDISVLKQAGTVYGCNAIYRDIDVHHLTVIDFHMLHEIVEAEYHFNHCVWTSPKFGYLCIPNILYFPIDYGYAAGPSALQLAVSHKNTELYLIGFDFVGLNGKVNNIYSDTKNYASSLSQAVHYGRWVKQIKAIAQQNPDCNFFRVDNSGFEPENFSTLSNFKTITKKRFERLIF